jgi:hypothetical protein
MLDNGQRLIQATVAPATNNQWLTATGPSGIGPATAPSVATGTVFDVSAWDAWSLWFNITTYGTVATLNQLKLIFFDALTTIDPPGRAPSLPNDPDLSSQLLIPFMTNNQGNASPTGNSAMVVGRTLGPLLAVLCTGTNLSARIEFAVHNRPRAYDAPYTPALLGTTLAKVPAASVAANLSQIVDLPYYFGPARFKSTLSAGSTAHAEILDDVAAANILSQHLATDPRLSTENLWIPPMDVAATKWSLRVTNGAAIASPAAMVVAG